VTGMAVVTVGIMLVLSAAVMAVSVPCERSADGRLVRVRGAAPAGVRRIPGLLMVVMVMLMRVTVIDAGFRLFSVVLHRFDLGCR
jgi:hypothetical protein